MIRVRLYFNNGSAGIETVEHKAKIIYEEPGKLLVMRVCFSWRCEKRFIARNLGPKWVYGFEKSHPITTTGLAWEEV